MNELSSLMEKPEFPRSSRYESSWIIENQMGPNALWLMEWLCEKLPLREGMRVLDLGCGRAMTSIFLSRELGLRVWAADLWMDPDNNWKRIVDAGEQDRLCPLRCEAHRCHRGEYLLPRPRSTRRRRRVTSFDTAAALEAA